MGRVTVDRGLLLVPPLRIPLSSPLEHGHHWPHHVDGKVRLRDGVTCPGPHSREVAAPGFEQRRRDWNPRALPDPPQCSLSHTATHLCTGAGARC